MTGATNAAFGAWTVAFVVPWLLVAQASPFYTSKGLWLAVGLWFLGLIAGCVCLLAGDRYRRAGWSIVASTVAGSLAWVFVVALLFNAASWD